MLEPYYKKILGYSPEDDDKEILKEWRENVSIACKPCWELKYCPYGPLVETFPVYPITKQEIRESVSTDDENLKKLGYSTILTTNS
jgi:hypothetical protein